MNNSEIKPEPMQIELNNDIVVKTQLKPSLKLQETRKVECYDVRDSNQIPANLQGKLNSDGIGLTGLAGTDLTASDYKFLGLDEVRKITSGMDPNKERKPIVVAIIDSGVDVEHPEFKDGKILTNFNKVKDRPGEKYSSLLNEKDMIVDYQNHGTMVAGIISTRGPENLYIINFKVLPTYFDIDPESLDVKDYGGCNGQLEDLEDALEHILELDNTPGSAGFSVDIVNMSVGHPKSSKRLEKLISQLCMEKILIAAAGNQGAQAVSTVQNPAKDPNVISVGACDVSGEKMNHSSHGDIDILCPGDQVRSTASRAHQENDYMVQNGTSFAAPFATAIAAHILASQDDQTRKILRSTRKMREIFSKIGSSNTKEKNTGYGVLRPRAAFDNNLAILNTHIKHLMEEYT